ncbi:MAG: hypothetical protein J6T14_00035 [Clostridia bacterium]|nr:hypothetical protein [Clostridia bacterium]
MTMTRRELYDGIWRQTVMGFAEEHDLNYSMLHRRLKEADIPKPGRRESMLIKRGGEGLREVYRPPLKGDPDAPVKVSRKREPLGLAEPRPEKAIRTERKSAKELETILNTEEAEEEPDLPPEAPKLIDYERHPRWQSLYFLKPSERRRVIREAENISVRDASPLHPEVIRLQREISAWDLQRKIVQKDPSLTMDLVKPAILDKISLESADRVLHILDSIYTSIEHLGGSVPGDGYVAVHGQPVELVFREGRSREPHEMNLEDELVNLSAPRWDLRYNGNLTLSISFLYSVRDKKREKLEDSLGSVLELIFTSAFQLSQASPREAKEIAESRNSYSRELERTEELIRKARDYEDAARIRRLILGVQRKLPGGALEYTENWSEWAAWASEKAEWLDPTVGRSDRILGRRHDAILDLSTEET